MNEMGFWFFDSHFPEKKYELLFLKHFFENDEGLIPRDNGAIFL